MYIYIYCIYISQKKIQHLPPLRRAASVARALSGNCSDERFSGRFRGGGGRRGTPLPPCRLMGLANLLGRQRGEPTASLRWLPLSFLDCFLFRLFSSPLFLHFCCLGTKSSRLDSENTINKINRDSESQIVHDVRGQYGEREAQRRAPSSLSLRGGVVTVEDLYIYTYIYIYMCMRGYIYIYSDTQMAARSTRRRGDLGDEENRRVQTEGSPREGAGGGGQRDGERGEAPCLDGPARPP